MGVEESLLFVFVESTMEALIPFSKFLVLYFPVLDGCRVQTRYRLYISTWRSSHPAI
jgi:hypothetical protein